MNHSRRRVHAGGACRLRLDRPGRTQAHVLPRSPEQAKNVIFFLGDGMGINTLTAARIYHAGEDGELTIDTLPESAFVKTFSNDAQVTDSAAVDVGLHDRREAEQRRDLDVHRDPLDLPGADANGNALVSRCENGTRRADPGRTGQGARHGRRRRHHHQRHRRHAGRDLCATPATASWKPTSPQPLVPGGAGYNAALGASGLDLVFGGGAPVLHPGRRRAASAPTAATCWTNCRRKGWRVASSTAQMTALSATPQPVIGLFAPRPPGLRGRARSAKAADA